jgi:hypothetical protein
MVTSRRWLPQVAITQLLPASFGFTWSPANLITSPHTRGWPVPIRLDRATSQSFPCTRGAARPAPFTGGFSWPTLSPPGRPIFRKGGAVVAFVGGDLKPYRRPGIHSLDYIQESRLIDGLDGQRN